MKKKLCISSLLILFFILSSGCQKKDDVVFVHLTDSHVNSPEREARLDSLLRDIESLVPAPEFILVTGDQTERGYRSELQAYDSVMATSSLPVYNTPGNHELRWSPYGKNAVQEHWGSPFQSIDCGPAQLLLLDSSMLLEHYGHYSPHLIARVRRELQRLGPDRPLILASHHPVMFEQRYVDNELAVLDMLEDFSPILYLTGHGHGFKHWSINSIDFFMTDAAKDPNPGYRLIRIENDSVHVYERDFNKQTLTRVLARSLPPVARPSVTISSPVPNAVVSNTLDLALTVPDSVTVTWRLSDAPWQPLKNRVGEVQQSISLAPFPDGQHWLQIQLTRDSLNTWREQVPITIKRENPAVAWRQKFDDEAQSAGCVWRNNVFVPSNSGTLRCLNIHDGNMVREISLPGSIVTTPAIHADTLFVTTTDGVCAAVSAISGAIFWQEKYADAIFSSPAWYENRLYFGTSDNKVVGINSGDGEVSWEFTTGKHVKCRPACDDGIVVFGSWDGNFYGVDAVSGHLKWQQQISANPYFPAATSNPLIHDGTVFVSSHDHAVHAFAVESGQRLWKHEKMPNQFGGYSSPAWWQGNLVFGSLSGHVFLLNAKTGQSVATIALNSIEDPIFDSSPLIADDHCFVGSVGGRLYDVNLKTQAVEYLYQVGDGYIFASPVLTDNKIVTAAMSGEIASIIID